MARVVRVVAVGLTTAVALLLLVVGYVFGQCGGWKGTGTCPRDPLWDWEMFGIVVWAGVLPTLAFRIKRHRLLRTVAEAAVAGVALGAIIVIVSGS